MESSACLDCHEHPDDWHPISQFLEPRFPEEWERIKAHMSVTCNAECRGVRVTQATVGYYTHCHQDVLWQTTVFYPPRVSGEWRAWPARLQCHSFHGSHVWKTPVSLDIIVPEAQV